MVFNINSDANKIKICNIIVVIRLMKNSSGTIWIKLDSSELNSQRSLEKRIWWNLIQKALKLYVIMQDKVPIIIKKDNRTLLKNTMDKYGFRSI